MFKKMLLTLSVLTLLTAGAAFAGDANWNFYGVGHVSLNMLNNGSDSQLGLTSNTSRFGFKGTTPMNEEFTAFWQFESLVDFAGNRTSTEIGARNTYVGVKHASAGKFVFGRHDTPLKALGRKVEIFPDQLGDFRSVSHGWDNRLSELFAWVSPDWDGFSIFAAYMFDQGDHYDMSDEDYEAMTAMSAMASYTAEKFMVGAAYEALSSGFGEYDGETDSYGDGDKSMRFVAKYTAPEFELGGLFQTMTYQYSDYTKAIQDWNSSLMGLGGVYHINPQWNVKAALYIFNDNTDAEDDTDTTDVDESDTKATMMAFGVERVFTETMLVYLQYGSISNGEGLVDNGGDVALAGNQAGFGTGGTFGTFDDSGDFQDPSGFSVGAVLSW
ncbi:MAG: porin [bacterium]|nr:porin [bacterium]